MNLISCTGLSFEYDGIEVLSNLDFTVKQDDYLCILGENGTGKSTLIKGLLGLKRPSKGAITYEKNLHPQEIGYLPQQTSIQRDFPGNVYEIVLSGCLSRMGLRPFYTKEEKQLAFENLEKLEITSLRKCNYAELSGGQQQRVLLARALCATKKILLLDEPTAGLDPMAASRFYELINQLNETGGITIIMVSHDVKQIAGSAKNILHLNRTTNFFGTIGNYRKTSLGTWYLGGKEEWNY